jgi:hypothetical protein
MFIQVLAGARVNLIKKRALPIEFLFLKYQRLLLHRVGNNLSG